MLEVKNTHKIVVSDRERKNLREI